MNKIILFFVFAFAFTISGFSQDISPNAIGLRLGDSNGFGAEISYQRAISDMNRLEFDLGWRDANDYNAFQLAGLYQWVFLIDGGFNWYVGAGGGLGGYDFDEPQVDRDDTGVYAYVAGDIGIEYNFPIPLLLSLDFRPQLGLGGDYYDTADDLDFDIALGIRYQF